jgi:hypothetical protein
MSVRERLRSNPRVLAAVGVAVRLMLILPLISVAALHLAVGKAEAHGGGPGLGYDPCTRQLGEDDFIHLAAYQPGFNPFAEYCGTLPVAGGTLLVLDLIGAELPGSEISLHLLAKDARFQLSVPARRYGSGVASVRADLPPGKYELLVNIEELTDSRHLTFPLVVGAWWQRLVAPVAFVLLIGVLTTGYCRFQLRSNPKRASSIVNRQLRSRL